MAAPHLPAARPDGGALTLSRILSQTLTLSQTLSQTLTLNLTLTLAVGLPLTLEPSDQVWLMGPNNLKQLVTKWFKNHPTFAGLATKVR